MALNVVIGIVGSVLDNRGKGYKRWDAWRPSVSVCMQADFPVARFELLHQPGDVKLAKEVATDIASVSPHTEVVLHAVEFVDPWDFEEVYSKLLDFSLGYRFDTDNEQYFLHITTGTHVAQICWFLLCEANYVPAQLLQSSPKKMPEHGNASIQFIDLDLSRYDAISSRFQRQNLEGEAFLKSGIETRNAAFNEMIQEIERVVIRSKAPLLLTGPTGAGKSQLAKRIYQLKHRRQQVKGEFVAVNCATLRGDNAMSTLFGHVRGAFTGAHQARKGLLAKADKGLLFLDEIGELGLDEQAMLLHAIEEKNFFPVGADSAVHSDFQLIAGTNKDLRLEVKSGHFRDDLLARINLWSYALPGLKDRREDIEPNIDYELQQLEAENNHKISFNKLARERYLKFALSSEAEWTGNFRDLNASIQRMATLADGGRINEALVDAEIRQLKANWRDVTRTSRLPNLGDYLDDEVLKTMDLFDQLQLAQVLAICQQCSSLSEAGRMLFNCSRLQKTSSNDSHRVRQYLAKFGLDAKSIRP
ncbi:RNA repair transcriptional activator RtcR [Permianibacter aggregans]|uniref:Transcriptional regulatory protein RtcR n=1 Tax=Permianibacter aggregans TaxID=1510150 RepID=A0A4R6U5I8_9GAMM|nr:RNA repair transcriptional activator RtcR [Permianibacter aggregans]QGX39852.1 AAA family ATPase [Permianibacter aggregans]TDQ41740.1 transcriptional regulatory protein RtcR [Permianibacter aggregans]